MEPASLLPGKFVGAKAPRRFPVTVFRLPSLDERGLRRVAVALDDQPATVLSGLAIATGNRGDAWARNVEQGVEKLTATVTVAAPGEHVPRMFMVDAAIAVDQIVVDTGGMPNTYHQEQRGGALRPVGSPPGVLRLLRGGSWFSCTR